MKTIRLVMLLGGALLFNSQQLSAASITFDFGTGDNNNNSQPSGNFGELQPGNWNPVAEFDALSTESITLSGLEMTINGVAGAAGGTWGANTQGLGIHTTGGAGSTAVQRRIDGSLGEAITFSFDQDVFLNSLTLGSFGAGEVATVTPAGGSAITIDDSAAFGPQDLRSLGGVAVTAGTLITLTTTTPTGGGVLFNQISVSVVPEPSTFIMFGVALLGLGLVRHRR